MKKILISFCMLSAFLTMVSCSENKKVNSESVVLDTESSEISENDENLDRPILSIEEKEISYSELNHNEGTVVKVDYSVSGIKTGWASSCVHICFDDRLEVQPGGNGSPSFERGDASIDMVSVMSVFWGGETPPDAIAGKNLDNICIITADSDNRGTNGVIASVDFIVPSDAKAGDVYKIGFFENDNDCFLPLDRNQDFQQFAFENWKDGYIKITE